MRQADFVVIGGGIGGASAAYELAGHGSVVLLEREQTLGFHTTGRSAAMFTEAYESGTVRSLTTASRSFFERPPPSFCDVPLLRPLPLLFLGRPDQERAVLRLADDVARLGPTVQLLDRHQILQTCPVLRPSYVGLGVLESDAREIDVHALHQAFVAGARSRGAEILTSAGVTALQRSALGWTVTAASANVIVQASAVVNAAGAWCDDVAVMAGGSPIGLRPMRRTAFTFPAPSGATSSGLPFVDDVEEQWYFKPEGGHFLGSLSEETPMEPHDVRPEEADVALAIERISRAVTFEILSVRSAWAGLRTFAPDRIPVVGEDPELEGFYWLAGQGGFGIMTSPALAWAVSRLVVEGRLPVQLEQAGMTAPELGPGRFR